MKIDWKGLLQGVVNSAVGSQWIKELAAYRYNTFCKPCQYSSTNAKQISGYKTLRPDEHCVRCGCNLEWKTHQLHSSCPIGKWAAEVTQAESEQITENIAAGKPSNP